jgi:hypothetical protein
MGARFAGFLTLLSLSWVKGVHFLELSVI